MNHAICQPYERNVARVGFAAAAVQPGRGTCAGTAAFSQVVTVTGNGTYSTTNTTFVASALGTWRWLVVYSGDANNDPTTSACGVESFTITNG